MGNRNTTKTTLTVYAKLKKNVSEESWMDNTEGSRILVRGRTNTLNLNWRNKFQNKPEECPCCGHESETLQHFLLECPENYDIRNDTTLSIQLPDADTDTKLGNILALTALNNNQIEDRKNYVKRLWNKRAKKVKAVQVCENKIFKCETKNNKICASRVMDMKSKQQNY